LRYYFDTSALLKRYLDEPGRKVVMDLLGSKAGVAVVSELTLPELSSAFRRAANGKRLSMEKARELLGRAREDLDLLSVAKLDSMVLARAVHLAMSQDLRALDAIHLATALEMDCSHMVSSDHDLLTASKLEGLKSIELQ
jgi:predicted nucleic acid-binding protein